MTHRAEDDHFDIARRDPWFWYCVKETMDTPEFLENWMRLRGFKIPKSPIETMIDEATGMGEAMGKQFIRDVYDTVYTRIPHPLRCQRAAK